MSDTAEIIIGDHKYTRFKKYRIESDLYAAAGAFEFDLYPDLIIEVKPGDRAQVYINGVLEMTGIIDRVSTAYDSTGRSINVAGRDLMGIVVDSYCEEWHTISNKNLIQVAEKLLKNVPYINRKSIEADDTAKKRDALKPYLQPSPGDRIFDVLKEAAASRGIVFYSTASGGLCFRKPMGRGAVVMNISRRLGKPNTYIIRGERVQDYSERYSKYTVLTQEQGLDVDDPPWINDIARVEDKGVPFYKPFVEAIEEDRESVHKRANMILEQRRAKSATVKYQLAGHSQGVYNWSVNELVRVNDDELDINDNLLIYSRIFEMSRGGITTELTLGEAGLVL
jgi:prophage tail gpP-like protein